MSPRSPRTNSASSSISADDKPAGGLVEQEEHGIEHEGPGDGDALLESVGERVPEAVAPDRPCQGGRAWRRPLFERLLFPGASWQSEHRRDQARPQRRLRAGHDVLDHGEAVPQLDPLQGAGDAHTEPDGWGDGDTKRRAAELHAAGAGADQSADHIEQGGLAGAVRSDEADDLVFGDLEADTSSRAATPANVTVTPLTASRGVAHRRPLLPEEILIGRSDDFVRHRTLTQPRRVDCRAPPPRECRPPSP